MSAIGLEIPVDIQRIVAGLERFVRAEVLPRHEKHAGLLDDPRKRYTSDGRYVPAVVDLIREVRVASADAGYFNLCVPVEWRVEPGGTYSGTWTTRQVAGSTRAGTTRMAGTVRVSGSTVAFKDWRDLIRQRRGDGLHGLTVDRGTGRTLSVYLERVP